MKIQADIWLNCVTIQDLVTYGFDFLESEEHQHIFQCTTTKICVFFQIEVHNDNTRDFVKTDPSWAKIREGNITDQIKVHDRFMQLLASSEIHYEHLP